MKLLSTLKKVFSFGKPECQAIDRVEFSIFGLQGKLIRKMCLPVPHEVSLFVPRLEITNKVTEGDKTTETTLVLNSFTIVSAPRPPESGRTANKPTEICKTTVFGKQKS